LQGQEIRSRVLVRKPGREATQRAEKPGKSSRESLFKE